MAQVIHLITSYLYTQKNYLDTKPQVTRNNIYTCITFIYNGMDIEVCVYNDTFIKLKVNQHHHAICDSIKTFRGEIERIHSLGY